MTNLNSDIIILDNGSGYLKCGFSSKEQPLFTIPSLIGRPMLRYDEKIENFNIKSVMIGDEVIPVRQMLDIKYPMKEGIIQDPEDIEKIWRYALTNKMEINPDNFPNYRVLLTEAPLNPTRNKEIMAEIIFERLKISEFNIEPQAKLSLIAEGRSSGIVLDSGDGVTHCIPIYENNILSHYIKRMGIAGRHITSKLIELLQLKGYAFNSSADFETIREMKEKYCFVSCDVKVDRKLDQETTFYNTFYKLPDNRTIRISSEKFEAPEILFNPMLIGSELPGVHELLFDSINLCPIDTRKSMYSNIILSGATTMFAGFSSRLEIEMKQLYFDRILKKIPSKDFSKIIDIVDTPRRKYSVFSGASFLAQFYETQPNYWITREEWEECGTRIIHDKCQNIIR